MGCVARDAEQGNREDVDTGCGGDKRSKVRVVGVSCVGDDTIECNCLIDTDVVQMRCQRGKERHQAFSISLPNSLSVCNKEYMTKDSSLVSFNV